MTVRNDGFDYMGEADKTCSVEFNPQHVNRDEFLRDLRSFIELSRVMNAYKKLLFRGKTPMDLGLSHPDPHFTLAGFFAPDEIDLLHGVIGVMTESGEAAEIVDRMLCGEQPDRVNAVEECGDLRWYINRVLRWAGSTDDECERANIAKLHGRGFAFGFNKDADSNRDLAAERSILEAGVQATDWSPQYRDLTLTLPLGPYGDEDDAGDQELADVFKRRPVGDCEGMDC